MATASSPAGYSGTPLAKKLSLKDGMQVWFDGMPETVRSDIDSFGLTLDHCATPRAPLDAAHIFVTARQDMVSKLALLEPLLAPAGFIWVSWPKKLARIDTDITEDVIRAMVLPGGTLVDVKVCAVDNIWSGLKLMIRKSAR